MLVNFHEDPVNLDQLCSDLVNDGVAVVFTTRTNFRAIAAKVDEQIDATVLPLSVEDHDHDWHHYLINTDLEEFDCDTTPGLILKAVQRWEGAGRRFPFSTRV